MENKFPQLWMNTMRIMLLVAVGCSPLPAGIEGVTEMQKIQLTSSAFVDDGNIPVKYTCDGEDISPPLDWGDLPENTTSLTMIADDPDAPGGTWLHWILYNIPIQQTGLPEGIENSVVLPGIGNQVRNDSRKTGYSGPCPPKGKPHRYFFKLYALDTWLELDPGATRADVEKAMQNHIVAQGQLVGMYSR